ncbi:MAG: TatD family hydrolase [Patescibacteria group bacterium]
MQLIDTHAHVNFSAFKADADQVIRRSLDQNIWLINVGSQYSTSLRAVEYAQKYPVGVYAAIGIHPIHLVAQNVQEISNDGEEEIEFLSHAENFDHQKYFDLAKSSPRVVAIGEIGLDYYHLDQDNREKIIAKQKITLAEQIDLANQLSLPLILHCREAYSDLINEVKKNKNKINNGGVIHCFGGNLAEATELTDLGFFLGFTGIITFKNAGEALLKVVKNIPLAKILIETDSPYLAPQVHRGKRNEPAYVQYVAQKVAEIKQIPLETVADRTSQNARNLFKI